MAISSRAAWGIILTALGVSSVIMFQQANGTVSKQINFQKSMNKRALEGLHVPSSAHIETLKNDGRIVKPGAEPT